MRSNEKRAHPRWRYRLPTVPLALFAGLFQLGGSAGRAKETGAGLTWPAVLLLLLGPAAILFLSRIPLAPLGVAAAASVTYAGLGYPVGPIAAAPVAALILEALRRRGERLAAVRREAAARREQAEASERVCMARDLHDVLGHSLTLINVHANAALHTLDERPDNAHTALRTIKAESHHALQEVRRVLDALRDPSSRPSRRPERTLLDVPALTASDPDTEWTVIVTGERGDLPASVDSAGYRVAQEAMTNVRRHAQARTAQVHIRYTTTDVGIDVIDDGLGAGATDNGTGTGLAGMRQRVTSLGGSLHAAPRPDGGFTVRAILPRTHPGDTP